MRGGVVMAGTMLRCRVRRMPVGRDALKHCIQLLCWCFCVLSRCVGFRVEEEGMTVAFYAREGDEANAVSAGT